MLLGEKKMAGTRKFLSIPTSINSSNYFMSSQVKLYVHYADEHAHLCMMAEKEHTESWKLKFEWA
jgi:hypothetical protein